MNIILGLGYGTAQGFSQQQQTKHFCNSSFEKFLFEKSFEYKMSSSAPSFNAVKAKYEQLKKSWEAKKLDDVGKHLLEMKIDLTMLNEDHWLIEPVIEIFNT